MRKFRVWLGKNVVGEEPSEEVLEFPDGTSDKECEEACADCLETMIGNELDTGWDEIT